MRVARVGTLGPQLQPTAVNCGQFLKMRQQDQTVAEPRDQRGDPICVGDSAGRAVRLRSASTITELILRAQGFVDRPLQDETRLDGNFQWELSFVLGADSSGDAPSLPTALQEQLGLKLVPTTGIVDVLVIDSVSMPEAD